jgi:hypothetical protein
MRSNRRIHHHRSTGARERRLAQRARCVADAYSAVDTVPERAPLDLLAYAECVIALEDAWDGLLETLAA